MFFLNKHQKSKCIFESVIFQKVFSFLSDKATKENDKKAIFAK